MNSTALAATPADDSYQTITRPTVLARRARIAAIALRGSAALWLGVAVLGQLLFAVYVLVFYGRAAASGHPEQWNKVLHPGYVPGDTFGNLVLASHLLFGALITIGGTLQLMPFVRKRWPRVHRWNGRVFLAGAAIAASGGLIMIWTRDAGSALVQNIAISINAILILLFGTQALRYALARRFDVHRRWTLRLFLSVNGGWFFRVGLMFWVAVNHGPAGFDPKTFTGPFITFLSFAQYLLPLAVLEGYLRAQRGAPLPQLGVAALLLLLTLAMGLGVLVAALGLWLPHL